MKKYVKISTVIFTILFAAGITKAQIPNAGFEDWAGNTPLNWVTGNVDNNIFITPSGDPHSGAFAAKLETKSIQGFLVPGVLSAGPDGGGFPVSQRHGQVSFYYKFHKTVNTAYFIITIGFKKGENGIGAAVLAINEPADFYTPITIPVTYINQEIPDLGVITFQVSDQNLSAAANGSYALIDDLSFTVLTDVQEPLVNPVEFSVKQNYPNPFNPTTTIEFTIPQNEFVTIEVFNQMGEQVALLAKEQMSRGTHSINFDGSDLASGIYFYQISAGKFSEVKKMMLLK